MRLIVRVIIVAVAAIGPLACARYEWVPDYEMPSCAASRRPTGGPPLTFEGDSAAAGTGLHGRVISGGPRPIPGASITLLTEPTRTTTTDSLGSFTFVDVPAGTHRLRTRRIGYRSRTDTLHLPLAGGSTLVLPLAAEMIDGPCSGFAAVRVRKPWWKLW